MPVSSPRKVISIPSVTMNALILSATIRKPLIAPISAPTASAIGIAQTAETTPAPCSMPLGRVSHAAMPGARPTVDSSERSILPLIRISDSASTSSAIHAMFDRTSVNVDRVRNAWSTK